MDTSALKWSVGVIARLLGTSEPALAWVSGPVVFWIVADLASASALLGPSGVFPAGRSGSGSSQRPSS